MGVEIGRQSWGVNPLNDHGTQLCAMVGYTSRSQLCKARGTWARIGQLLQRENAPPRVSAKFYKAIMPSVLLYGSETWVLSPAVMARLEGFHIRAAYWMAKKHVPRWGPDHQWVYPPSKAVLEECGMHTIQHYIDV